MCFFSFQVLSSDNPKYGYAAAGKYEDFMVAGIIDPAKVTEILWYMRFIQENSYALICMLNLVALFSISRIEDIEPQVLN